MTLFQTLWAFVGYLVPFVAVLSVVVFIHELGHFLVGRWCGVKVEAFSVGFGPEIFAFNDRHETRWRFALFPLGGYVKFYGDSNAASMSDEEIRAAMSPEERKISLYGQSVGRRAAIVAAGPIANFLLAIVIFAGVFYFHGKSELTPRIADVRAGEAADKAGLQAGDLVLSIDGKRIASWTEMQRIVQVSADIPLSIRVERAGKEVTLTATPVRRDIDTQFGKHRVGLLGVTASSARTDWQTREYGFFSAWSEGTAETWYVVTRTIGFIGGVFTGRESPEQISGAIRIAEVSGEFAKISILALIQLAAVLSVSVGLLNLFPIPPLDGGHLLYFAVEAAKGRPLSQNSQEMGFRIGIALVLALMVFATFNDIMHVGPKLLRLFG
ncbi:MAG: RIP metalloprotease RseP [Alphaproteobacteria bacterium]|nr:RIP metalloprotease RseP [Alphaproteobacteria bacterium]